MDAISLVPLVQFFGQALRTVSASRRDAMPRRCMTQSGTSKVLVDFFVACDHVFYFRFFAYWTGVPAAFDTPRDRKSVV